MIMSDKLLCIKVPTTDVNLLMQIAADPVKATQSRWFRVLPKTLVQTNIGVICYKMQVMAVFRYEHQLDFRLVHTKNGEITADVRLSRMIDVSDQHPNFVNHHVDMISSNPVTLITADDIK